MRLEQMECVYHGGSVTSLVTSDVSPINTRGGSQLLRQQNMLVRMVGMPGPAATPIIPALSGRGQPDFGVCGRWEEGG